MGLERHIPTYPKPDFLAPQKHIFEYRSKQIELCLKLIQAIESEIHFTKDYESMRKFVLLYEKCIAFFESATFEQSALIFDYYPIYRQYVGILPAPVFIRLHPSQWKSFKFELSIEKIKFIEELELLTNQIFGHNWDLRPFYEFTDLVKQFGIMFKRVVDLADLDLLTIDDRQKLLIMFKKLPHSVSSSFDYSFLRGG
jgi:hypothetical protein